jgi:hypothetical protein
MSYSRSYDVALAAASIKKGSAHYKELKRAARRANREVGEPVPNFAVIWLSGARPVFRFFNERAAQQFRQTAPAGSLA